MKTTTRNILLALGALLVLACVAMFSVGGQQIYLDGEEMTGIAGIGIGIVGCAIGLLAAFFALSLTGLVLAAVAFFLVLLGVLVFGAVAIAMSPLLLPLFLLLGVVWMMNRRRPI